MLKGLLLCCVLVSLVLVPVLCTAQPAGAADVQSLLSAFMYYTDLRVRSVQQSLEILASTAEAQSANWDNMKGLLTGYQKSDSGFVVWFVLPDGSYYTVDKGLMDVKLNDREYFPHLVAGHEVTGSLVVSKSTGQRSAVIAVPVKKGDKVVGAVGASLFLDALSDQVDAILAPPADETFFALAPNGLTTIHRKTDRNFLDPRTLGSETLAAAVNEMLSKPSGEVTYVFDQVTKKAVYRTSSLTGWKFAIAFNEAGAK